MKNKSVPSCRFFHHAKFHCIILIWIWRGGGTGKEPKLFVSFKLFKCFRSYAKRGIREFAFMRDAHSTTLFTWGLMVFRKPLDQSKMCWKSAESYYVHNYTYNLSFQNLNSINHNKVLVRLNATIEIVITVTLCIFYCLNLEIFFNKKHYCLCTKPLSFL